MSFGMITLNQSIRKMQNKENLIDQIINLIDHYQKVKTKNYNIFQTTRFNHTMIFFKLTN